MLGEILLSIVFLAGGYLLGDQVDFPWGGVLLAAASFFLLKMFYFRQFAANLKTGVRPWLLRDDIWHGLLEQLRQTHKEYRPSESSPVPAELIQGLLSLPFGLIFIGTDNTIQQLNSHAEKLFRLKTPDDIGANLMHLVRQPDFIKALEHKHGASGTVLQNYSARKLMIHIIPCCDIRLVLIQDITEMQRMEEARRKLAANISHELRTPLTIIRGYVETLQDMSKENPLPPGFDDAVTEIVQHTAQMNDIIGNSLFLDQLDGRRPDKKAWTQINVGQLVKNMVASEQRNLADKHCTVKTTIDADYWIVGNERELHSAFSNLLNNALRHSDDGGEVRLSWYIDSEGGHFSVEDEGEGIPSGDIAFLTERFYRVDYSRADKYGGTGLGLAIVKHVLSRHEASLIIDSEVGKGSVFRCDFPMPRLIRQDQSAESSGDV